MVFKNLCFLLRWTKVASALEGLIYFLCLTDVCCVKGSDSISHVTAGTAPVIVTHPIWPLTLPMLRLLSSNASTRTKDFWKTSKPCHIGIHWIAPNEFYQISIHGPGFQSFFRIFVSFCFGKISHQQHIWDRQCFSPGTSVSSTTCNWLAMT